MHDSMGNRDFDINLAPGQSLVFGEIPDEIHTLLDTAYTRDAPGVEPQPTISDIRAHYNAFAPEIKRNFEHQDIRRKVMIDRYKSHHRVVMFKVGGYARVRFPDDLVPTLGDLRFGTKVNGDGRETSHLKCISCGVSLT